MGRWAPILFLVKTGRWQQAETRLSKGTKRKLVLQKEEGLASEDKKGAGLGRGGRVVFL